MTIGGYFINGYWWLFHCKPLVVIFLMAILLMGINGYCIINYCWLLYYACPTYYFWYIYFLYYLIITINTNLENYNHDLCYLLVNMMN